MQTEQILEEALNQFEPVARRLKGAMVYCLPDGTYQDIPVSRGGWTDSFYCGMLHMLYRNRPNPEILTWTKTCEEKLDDVLWNYDGLSHDIGFLWNLTAAENYRQTGDRGSRSRALLAASALAARFNANGNFIRAWNGGDREGWAIIDCMMNLALLYWASEEENDPRFRSIAQKHADTVLAHFIRPDGSAKHICVFDPVTGEYIENLGGQGFDENSSWSRGLAWALYGMVISYAHTTEERYKEAAQQIYGFLKEHLPEDFVPWSDYTAEPKTRDSSAGSIAAAGLAHFYRLTGREEYKELAEKILQGLWENYRGEKDSLLSHGCAAYHIAPPNDDTPLIYGDYYFLEALTVLSGKEGIL